MEHAIASVQATLTDAQKSIVCGEYSISAVEVKTTTLKNESSGVVTNTIYVDEWGIEETIYNSETKQTSGRLWSVNGRDGIVKFVGNYNWDNDAETCSVESPSA